MISSALVVLSWFLIGPPFPLAIVFECCVMLAIVCLLRHRFRHETFALITMMGLMLIQGIVIVFVMHFQPWQPGPNPNLTFPGASLLQTFFRLELPIAELGAAAAVCVGIYIQFGRSRLDLAQAFPDLAFYDPSPDLVQRVERLAACAKIPCPTVRLVDSGAPSAFTFRARGEYIIVVSIGLLESFDDIEVEACIAHEISHIKNRDFTLRTMVTIARVALFTRVLSYLVESAFYRTRELIADRTAATLMGGPGPLISALTKLQKTEYTVENFAGAAICRFDGRKGIIELFSKHPNLSTRIRLLMEMESPQN